MRLAGGFGDAGIPPEMRGRVDGLLAREPEHPEPKVAFSIRDYDRRPLTLRRLMAPFRWALLGALLLVIVETVAMRIGPLLTQLAIDHGMGLKDMGTGSRAVLGWIFVAFLGSIALAIVASYWRIRWTGVVGERLLYTLRVQVFSHLQRLSHDFFDRQRKGALISRMTSDIEHLQTLFHEGLVQFVVQGLTMLVLAAQLFWFSPRLALLGILLILPSMTALTWWFSSASARGYLAVRDRLAELLTHLSESVAGIRVVSAHNRQRRNIDEHVAAAGRYQAANNYTASLSAVFGPGSEMVGKLTVVVVLLIGGGMVLAGDMRVGEMAGFVLAITTFFAPMQQLAQLYNAYQQGQAGMTKLRQLLLTEPSVQESEDAYALPDIAGRVTLERVSFGYLPGEDVLHEVSLEIEPGQTCAVVGATGAGKSTIAKLITRSYDTTRGRVLIDGHDLCDVRLASLRRHIGAVAQEPFLFNGTIRDNIAFARPSATDDDVEQAARTIGLGDFLDRAPGGIHTAVFDRGGSLASGERQLVVLARALLAQPKVLILDEATSSLDLKTERMVDDALDVLLAGRTAIIIAHRLATAMRADRIVVIGGGRIIERGSHDELLALGGKYAELFIGWQRQESVAGQVGDDVDLELDRVGQAVRDGGARR